MINSLSLVKISVTRFVSPISAQRACDNRGHSTMYGDSSKECIFDAERAG